jgi:hypothetical protein
MRVLLTIFLSAMPGAAAAQDFLAQMVSEADPCGGLELSERVFGLPVSIGLQQKGAVRIGRVALSIEEEMASLDLAGGLSCETTPGSVLSGDAELDIEASATVALADCSVTELALTPTRFGGYLADVLEAGWTPLLEPALAAETEALLVRACKDLTAPAR